MIGKFTFHPVGQGLFYSGSIGSFNFIYDCGSFNKKTLHKEIGKLCNDLSDKCNKPEIDLLIISHFHYDHICGMEYLFYKFKINNVIIPYMTDEQKLFTVAKLIDDFSIANTESIEDNQATDDLFQLKNLIINPYDYFRERTDGNISILGEIDNTAQSPIVPEESESLHKAKEILTIRIVTLLLLKYGGLNFIIKKLMMIKYQVLRMPWKNHLEQVQLMY